MLAVIFAAISIAPFFRLAGIDAGSFFLMSFR